MHEQNCIFCKIIAGHVPGKIIHETSHSIVLQDIAPQAPIHYLIIPKQHIQDIASCTDKEILCDLMSIPAYLSTSLGRQQNSDPVDFKLLTNNGYAAGQRVFHLHLHFLAGKVFSE